MVDIETLVAELYALRKSIDLYCEYNTNTQAALVATTQRMAVATETIAKELSDRGRRW